MGKLFKGILGGFSGTVGTVIGGTWKGIAYMRSLPSKSKKDPTPAQINQHLKFKVVIRFIQTMGGLLMVGFRNYAIRMTGINCAFSYTMKNAVTGVAPNYVIDYPRVLISRGDLLNAGNPAAVVNVHAVNFSWVDNSGQGMAKATDKAILAVFCEDFHQTLYSTAGNARSTGADSVDVTIFAGKTVQTYIGFISEDGREISDSFYTGALAVAP